MTNNTVKIELNNEEAELFKKFRQYQDVWEGIFQIKSGKAILHFDELGILRKIEYNYQKRIEGKGILKKT